MDSPSHWEDGAAIVGGTFFDLWEDEGALNFPDEHAALVFIEDQMIDLRSMYFTPGQPAPTVREEPGVAHLFANIGAAAFDSYVRVGHDSPTTASVSPAFTVKPTPSTARSRPPNSTDRSSTRKSSGAGPFTAFLPDRQYT